jgi:hypothetical protein
VATSTEATVRDVLIAMIQGLAQSSLGFDEPQGNVRAYPVEMHQAEQRPAYLKASVDGKQVPRAWAVDVQSHEVPFAMRQIPIRTYTIRLIGYYGKDSDGTAYHALINGARKIRGAFNAITPTISETVTRILNTAPLSIDEVDGGDSGQLFVGTLLITAEKTAPDF